MEALLITLGHNSSAIFTDGENVIGYEQERLDGIKASSRFPSDAINEIMKHVGFDYMSGCKIFISHWFSTGFNPVGSKYMSTKDFENLQAISEDITFVNKLFSHHDAHAYAALAFFEKHYSQTHSKIRNADEINGSNDIYTIVADGFGNDEEVFSLYRLNNNKQEIVFQHRGYFGSLGLMYQYATSFCGMKENQDEYKFLGYEPMIEELVDEKYMAGLDYKINKTVEWFMKHYSKPTERHICTESVIDFARLLKVKTFWYEEFSNVIGSVNISDNKKDSVLSRVVIAYYIQQVIEKVLISVILEHKIKHVIVAGGIFYNVKLNNAILRTVPGLFCAMPLAGDQGAAIGMYTALTGHGFNFKSLSIGERSLWGIEKVVGINPNVTFMYKENDSMRNMAKVIADRICEGQIVNLVEGNMEFGPRALCNTSTLFLPLNALVMNNNSMNNRNEVMPCAPVMKAENAGLFFDQDELDRVVGSDKFMICTHEYKVPGTGYGLLGKQVVESFVELYGGVAHKMPFYNEYTGRPQIVEQGSFIWAILDEVEKNTNVENNKCLVNTSFNAHGRPIVFDTMDIIHNFNYQVANAGNKKPHLYIVL